jgi:predicted nucleic acid-binding protein
VVPETGSEDAARLWSAARRLVVSPLVYPEARAAIGRAHRAGRLPGSRAAGAREVVSRLLGEADMTTLADDVLRRAGTLAEEERLRAYDAVHLASFERVPGGVLVTVDGQLARAARSLGYAVAVPAG